MRKSNLPHPEILYEVGSTIVLNKPGGLLTQGPPGIDSLELRTKKWLIERENKPGKAYLGVPHRLDRPVSGAIVVTKNVRAAKRIAEQFQNRTVEKVYWAVVEGSVAPTETTWQDSMRKIPDEAKSEIVDADHPDAKEARMRVSVVDSNEKLTLLKIQLETGRTHQIRLQCASRNHPIVGDALYGSTRSFGPETEDIRKRWIALHARRLSFLHPVDKVAVDCEAPFPTHWNCFECFGSKMESPDG